MGLWLTYLVGLALPDALDEQACINDTLWRFSYSLQLIPVVITSALWIRMFPTEPIPYLLFKSEQAKTNDDEVAVY